MSHDDDLARLLRDAVSDVEPTDRLAELRTRTATTRGTGLRWGAALAAAAAVVVVVGVVATSTRPDNTPGPLAPDPTVSSTGPAVTEAVAAYFIGEAPTGPRLFREFQAVADPVPGLAGLGLLETGADDPDYTSQWPAGSFDAVSGPEGGVVEVSLGAAAPARPSDLALQQVAYTVAAGFQERLDVTLVRGTDVVAEVSPLPPLEVLALVNLTDPVEGQAVDRATGTLEVRGVASSFEATVPWRVERDGAVVAEGFATAEGWGERLYPFSTSVDVSSLEPGTYTLIVETSDPSGGSEGAGPTSDDRTFVVQ